MNIHEKILEKRLRGERLNLEEGILLYSCDLLKLGRAAQELTRRLRPHVVTFVVDRNVSYTNVCAVGCEFCAFHCPPGAAEAYVLTKDEILEKVRELVELGGTQVMIQGGVDPSIPLDYYLGMVRAVHEKFPQVHIHSFSAVEMDMLSRQNNIPLPELFRMFKDAGLNSLPGGGAEILVERVRKLVSPGKISSERWLEVMRTAHEAGLRSTATMVFGLRRRECQIPASVPGAWGPGPVETLEERIIHLLRLRELQDQTHGFRAFIPWSFVTPRVFSRGSHPERSTAGAKSKDFIWPKENALSEVRMAGGDDYLKTVAIARLMLDNFDHIQSGWLTEGMKLGQIALAFGCDDMGGTLIEDKVLEPAGIEVRTRQEDLISLIKDAGYVPAQRDTNYNIIKTFDGPIGEKRSERGAFDARMRRV